MGQPREPVEIRLDGSGARLFVAIRASATGAGFAAAMARLYREHPEMTAVDKLYDLTEYRGAVTQADVAVIVEAYMSAGPDAHHPCRTAFVTPDPNFGLWATAMSHLFIGREHRAFRNFEEAQAFLDVPLTVRAPFVPT